MDVIMFANNSVRGVLIIDLLLCKTFCMVVYLSAHCIICYVLNLLILILKVGSSNNVYFELIRKFICVY